MHEGDLLDPLLSGAVPPISFFFPGCSLGRIPGGANTNRDDLLLRVGSDDQSKVYLNGHEIFRWEKTRGLTLDQDEVPIRLRQGTNVLVFKVVNVRSGWTGSLHFVGKDGRPAKGIRFGLEPE
jgi:hypothetical protein